MHKPESDLENKTHNIVFDFEIQMDHSIAARSSDLMLNNNKRTRHLVDFATLADNKEEMKDKEKINKYLVFAREQKKTNCGTRR